MKTLLRGYPPNSQVGVPVFIYIVKRMSGAVHGEITALSGLTLFIPTTPTTVALVTLKLPCSGLLNQDTKVRH